MSDKAEKIAGGVEDMVYAIYKAIGQVSRIEALKLKPTLTPAEVEDLYGISAGTLCTKRSRGSGPDYYQASSGGFVLYTHEDIKAWLARCRRKGS